MEKGRPRNPEKKKRLIGSHLPTPSLPLLNSSWLPHRQYQIPAPRPAVQTLWISTPTLGGLTGKRLTTVDADYALQAHLLSQSDCLKGKTVSFVPSAPKTF